MSETTVDNRALFLGANSKNKCVLEVPAGVERTLPQGAFLSQKIADGTLFVLQELNLSSKIVGMLNADILVPASAGSQEIAIERVYDGHIDEKLAASRNSIANLDIIPAGASESYRLQLEDIGFQIHFRQSVDC